jgi:phosphohistidine phosphatase
MSRELLLLRHGKAAKLHDGSDRTRPLKDKGKRGAQRMGIYLAQQDLVPELVISSPAERALNTAEKCCKTMGLYAGDIITDTRLYNARDVEELLCVLAGCPPEAGRVLLVGHNPGLQQLMSHLAGPSAKGLQLKTATLAQITMPGNWRDLKPAQATLVRCIKAKDLPDKFPFPCDGGIEWRDRPAYYYSQSAVIPYRQVNGQLQILIVRSSQNKHWVVPKGIIDPGKTAQQSAQQEALEEAGVEGIVHERALGHYQYHKWGATCTVSVYPLTVTRMLDEAEWQEQHRGRHWVSPEQAIAMLHQPELGPLVRALMQQLQAH